jgi:hypothetical protein
VSRRLEFQDRRPGALTAMYPETPRRGRYNLARDQAVIRMSDEIQIVRGGIHVVGESRTILFGVRLKRAPESRSPGPNRHRVSAPVLPTWEGSTGLPMLRSSKESARPWCGP